MYFGPQHTLDNFIIPNIGLDYPIYHLKAPKSLELVGKARINKVLMQRYTNIEVCKEAQVIGILIGTVVVNNYAALISHLKNVISSTGRKCYEVLVCKLNEPKLRNLQTIDVYVYV